jgi:cytochrome c oxidase subunit 4
MDQHKHHIVDYITQMWVWVILLILTGVTVAIAEVDFKMLTVAVALGIATIKSLFVLAYFMHLKFDSKILSIFVIVVLLVFLSFIILTFIDYYYR